MFKKYKNNLSGSTFSVIDIDVATAKYIGIVEAEDGMVFKAMLTPKELEENHYYEVRA